MRSINTAVVALLPVGGLLFIGAGLLGAGTLKDLGLVLFVGMLAAVYSSIFFATPVLVDLKEAEPRFKQHKQRVLQRRAAGVNAERKAAKGAQAAAGEDRWRPRQRSRQSRSRSTPDRRPRSRRSAPRPGARPAPRKRPGAGAKPGGSGKPGGTP